MKIRLSILLPIAFLFSVDTFSQGIRFEEKLNWQEIKDKAKKENKYIFVDCYATWCGPCKQMDQKVYPNDSVGTFYNDKFISVKVQMDISENDPPNIKSFYLVAQELRETYSVNVLPSYLFISPTGKVVHKDVGMKNVTDFIKLGENAINPSKQLYTLLDRWRTGNLLFEEMPVLAMKLRNDYQDKEKAIAIATDYQARYLNKLSDSEYLKKENLLFIANFTAIIRLSDNAYKLFYNYPKKVDSILRVPNYSKGVVDYVVAKEMIDPYIKKANNEQNVPNWKSIEKAIIREVGSELAERNITSAKVRWYGSKNKHDPEFAKNFIREVEFQGLSSFDHGAGFGLLNNKAWTLFSYSEKPKYLKIALDWVEYALRLEPNAHFSIDTKANLLYKLGRTEEAIELQTKLVELSNGKVTDFNEHLDRMKKDLPTWKNSK